MNIKNNELDCDYMGIKSNLSKEKSENLKASQKRLMNE